jgi:hypothetical protein
VSGLGNTGEDLMTENKIKLDEGLADKLVDLLGNIRKAGIDLAILACEIRSQYFDLEKKRYDKGFNEFWTKLEMDKKFGGLSNFTKYAKAGEGVKKIQAIKVLKTYEKRLPTSIQALYEMSFLQAEEMELCFQNTYSRSEVTMDQDKWKKPTTPKPLLTPSTTAAQIKNWREKWHNPRIKPTDKRRLEVVSIKVHGSLLDFDKDTADHIGKIDKQKVRDIANAVVEAMKPFSSDIVRVDLRDEEWLSKFDQRQEKIKTEIEKRKKKSKKKKSKN